MKRHMLLSCPNVGVRLLSDELNDQKHWGCGFVLGDVEFTAESRVERDAWLQVLRRLEGVAERERTPGNSDSDDAGGSDAGLAAGAAGGAGVEPAGVVFVEDAMVKVCSLCAVRFSLVKRRHHCRACGQIICGFCSQTNMVIEEQEHRKRVRVCDKCVKRFRALSLEGLGLTESLARIRAVQPIDGTPLSSASARRHHVDESSTSRSGSLGASGAAPAGPAVAAPSSEESERATQRRTIALSAMQAQVLEMVIQAPEEGAAAAAEAAQSVATAGDALVAATREQDFGAVLRALRAPHCDPNYVTGERRAPALHLAAAAGAVDIAALLLLHHANVNLRNAEGETALHAAAAAGHDAMAELLLESGAAPLASRYDDRECTPLLLARKQAVRQVVLRFAEEGTSRLVVVPVRLPSGALFPVRVPLSATLESLLDTLLRELQSAAVLPLAGGAADDFSLFAPSLGLLERGAARLLASVAEVGLYLDGVALEGDAAPLRLMYVGDGAAADTSLHREIGTLSGVQPEALDFLIRDEVNHFRRCVVARLAEQSVRPAGSALALRYQLSPLVCGPGGDVEAAARVLVRFYPDPVRPEHKAMFWDLRRTAAQTLAWLAEQPKIFARFDVPVPDPAACVLLLWGKTADYLAGADAELPLLEFASVRRALNKRVDLHVTLQPLADVEAGAARAARADAAVAARLEDRLPSRHDVGRCAAAMVPVPHAALSLLGPVDGLAETLALGHRLAAASPVLSLWDLQGPFEAAVEGVEGVAVFAARQTLMDGLKGSELRAAETAPILCYAVAAVWHGTQSLARPQRTEAAPLAASTCWRQRVRFPELLHRDLPLGARLCVTVFAVLAAADEGAPALDPERDTPLGWGAFELFDYTHRLGQGRLFTRLWPGERANSIAPAIPNPSLESGMPLAVRLLAFAGPVVHPQAPVEQADDFAVIAPRSEAEAATLATLLRTDQLTPFTEAETALLQTLGPHMRAAGLSPVRYLRSVSRRLRPEMAKAHALLAAWPLESAAPLEGLELLDASFADPVAREFGVRLIARLSDAELLRYMMQLVQALKYEAHHENPLVALLLRRALANRRVGHALFWTLRSEAHIEASATRFGLYMFAYLWCCGAQTRALLAAECALVRDLEGAAVRVKKLPRRTKAAVGELLGPIASRAQACSCVLDPCAWVGNLRVAGCKAMDSKKVPLWLVFESASVPLSGAPPPPVALIFKTGDDLRQDMLTLQLMGVMEALWHDAGLDLALSLYRCAATGDQTGLIEVVGQARTLAEIQMLEGGSLAAFKETVLLDWLRKANVDERSVERAMETFARSCAGYCVATYVLGIGDRHNDNIMLDVYGHLFHIDFGHFMGNIKRFAGINRERTPFVLTPDMTHAMGGRGSPHYALFEDLCVRAFNVLRGHSHTLISLLGLMLNTGIPELRQASDVNYLRDVMRLGASDAEAGEYFLGLIKVCNRKGWTTQLNWAVHNLVHASAFLKKKI